MTGPGRRLLILVVVLAGWVVAPAAGAIPNTCPTSGPDAGIVNIVEPSPGATFAGQVTVRGRASAPTGLSRIELFVGEALKDFQLVDPAQTDVEYFLRFDVAGVQSNRPVLTVVACGAAPVRGVASIEVAVDRGAVVTAPPIAITPVEQPETGDATGPAWVGAAFGLAGLVGLLFARVRTARGASGPSPAAGAADAGRPPAPAGGAPPPGPSRGRRTAEAPPAAARGRRATAPVRNGRRSGRRRGERPEPAGGDGRPPRRR